MKIIRTILPFLSLLLAFAPALAQHQATSATPSPLGPEKWREDIRFFAERMPATHKNLFHKMTKEEFAEAVRRLNERLPGLADHEVVVELMRIIAKVGDGHTGAHSGPYLFAKGVYPV